MLPVNGLPCNPLCLFGEFMQDATSLSIQQAAPEGPLLAYYGDDFTGSTDVMEAFTAAGVPTVLFLQTPRPSDLARFAHMRCVGLAGTSRGRDGDWMQAHLPAAFDSLRQLGAPLLQYKVCSTFDSAPHVGSIGRAIDIGTQGLAARWSPTVVGAPRLQRYQLFGQLFAAFMGQVYRIDRHPSMSRHPVTPMDEADLRLHLGRQTARRIELIDLVQLTQGQGEQRLADVQGDDQPVVMLDVADAASQIEAGRLVWENRGSGLFSASSSGLQYALVAYWRSLGWLPAEPSLPLASPASTIAVVSGSCSVMSGAQIEWALHNGFHGERVDVSACLQASTRETEIERVVEAALQAIRRGVSPVVYSAMGPDDPAVLGFETQARTQGLDRAQAADGIGMALAEIMKRLLDGSDLRRIVVAGGDSSGAVASHLGVQALTVAAGLRPGAPLCRAWSDDPRRDGLELVLKGGQMGTPSFYGEVRSGDIPRG
jgi:uncharacterized protein YgbK (DUF1537 family)